MRVLFISTPHPESVWFFKALQESAHSLQRSDDLRDGVFLASQESFDAIVVMSVDPFSYPALLAALPEFAAAPGAPAVVVVAGIVTAQQRARMLRAGADACFGQPHSFIEVHERMLALRRTAGTGAVPGPLSNGTLALDVLTHELTDGTYRVPVTRREYLLLECLMRQISAPVPRDQLIRYAWPEKDDVDPSSVNQVVSRLRRKLMRDLPGVLIETVSRYGYQITARH